VNIAIANEFASLAERFGIDVWEAIAIANRHPRVKILNPGPGVGGHCISVDPWFLVEAAPDITSLIQTARRVNDGRPQVVVERIRSLLGELKGRRIAVLGLAYKPDVDDLRESPAIEVAHLLVDAGAEVKAFEPNKPDAQITHIQVFPTLDAALSDAEIIVILVAHTQFRSLSPEKIGSITSARLIFDAVHALSAHDWSPSAFSLTRLGDGS
jgi:UDP-N-acetyl-D-mannosaminuronic acid dehydrogenase